MRSSPIPSDSNGSGIQQNDPFIAQDIFFNDPRSKQFASPQHTHTTAAGFGRWPNTEQQWTWRRLLSINNGWWPLTFAILTAQHGAWNYVILSSVWDKTIGNVNQIRQKVTNIKTNKNWRDALRDFKFAILEFQTDNNLPHKGPNETLKPMGQYLKPYQVQTVLMFFCNKKIIPVRQFSVRSRHPRGVPRSLWIRGAFCERLQQNTSLDLHFLPRRWTAGCWWGHQLSRCPCPGCQWWVIGATDPRKTH